jgi:hypothetical protein
MDLEVEIVRIRGIELSVVSARLLFPFVNKDVNQSYRVVHSGMSDQLF